MDLTSRQNIKDLLAKYELQPSKRFGQNFLIDKRALGKVVETAELTSQDTVLEIGPGMGALTQELAKKAGKVVAIEKDRNMVKILKETLKNYNNIEVVQRDILKLGLSNSKFEARNSKQILNPNDKNSKQYLKHLNLENLNLFRISDLGFRNSYKVVSNLPFYLTAPVIRQFLENTRVRPVYLVLVVQKEVGQRICAKPPDMNLLAVSVQVYAEPKIIAYVSKNSFWPQPEVNAAILKIVPKPQLARTFLANSFFKIVKAGFSQPRKQLINNLSQGLKINRDKVKSWLLENNIRPIQRAETLEVADWINLTKY